MVKKNVRKSREQPSKYIKPRWKYLHCDKKGIMYIDGVSVKAIEKKFGTPVYVIVESELRDRLRKFKKAFPYARLRPQYPGKTNTNLEILRIVREEGFDLDASSVGEIILGLLADFKPSEITFTNLFRTEQDIMFAARVGVMAITIDSVEELKKVENVAEKMRKRIKIFLRFNPMIEAYPNSTKKHKYGIPINLSKRVIDYVAASKQLEVVGLHFHGGYIFNPQIYSLAAKKLLLLSKYCLSKNIKIRYIDLGGGFPFEGQHRTKKYFTPEDIGPRFVKEFKDIIEKLQIPYPTLIFEPGKNIVANIGIGLMKVVSKKNLGKKTKMIVTDGSTYAFLPDVLITPQYYEILPATKMKKKRSQTYTIAGLTCDCIDVIGKNRWLPMLEENDLVAAMDCGAYSNVMASNFNNLRKAPMVMIKENGTMKLIRRRDRYSEMFAPELDVLKIADPNELKKLSNMSRINVNKIWKGSKTPNGKK